PPPKRPLLLKHEVEPEIAISGIPWLQQTKSSFFGDNSLSPIYIDGQPLSNSDFYSSKGLQFDYEDRITQRNIISALITNRFIKKTWSGDDASYRQVVLIKNGTNYEFDKPEFDVRANFSDIFSIVEMRFDRFETSTAIRYFPLHDVFNTSSWMRLHDLRGNFLQVSFSQNFLITENTEEAYSKRDENLGVSIGLVRRYATASATLNYLPANYAPLSLMLKSWSADFNIRPPGDCWGVRVQVAHLLSEPQPRYILGLNYDFGGSL
ncbi:MAG: hypothetical protein RBT63_04440, partial [Bdellovibrionales bacterium]|nr:hypothetical protein [Bdellovibrionales bacterium]